MVRKGTGGPHVSSKGEGALAEAAAVHLLCLVQCLPAACLLALLRASDFADVTPKGVGADISAPTNLDALNTLYKGRRRLSGRCYWLRDNR